MKKILINHFHILRMAISVGWETPKIRANSYGTYDFNNYITFEINGFRFHISCEYFIFWKIYKISISVDNIEVYRDGWIHSVPSEMKRQIMEAVKEMEVLNKEYKNKKLNQTYNNHQKQKEANRKQREIKKFEDEKKLLIEKFK